MATPLKQARGGRTAGGQNPLPFVLTFDDNDGTPRTVQTAEVDGALWRVFTAWSPIGGRLEPVSVEVRSATDPPRPVRGEILKKLNIGSLHAEARRRERDTNQLLADPPHEWTATAARVQIIDHLLEVTAAFGAHGGVATSDDELAALAIVYMDAHRSGGVTQAVADHFNISKSTAGKRIMRARERGFLPSAEEMGRR